MVHACGDFLANPCILLKSPLTSPLERSGNCHLTHTHTHVFYTVQQNLKVSIMLCSGVSSISWITPSQAQTDLSCSVVFQEACHLLNTFTGFNTVYENTFGKQYSDQDWLYADVIRDFQCRPQSIQLLKSEQVQISEMLYTIATA